MLASIPASMLNQKPSDLGIPNRFKLDPSGSSVGTPMADAAACQDCERRRSRRSDTRRWPCSAYDRARRRDRAGTDGAVDHGGFDAILVTGVLAGEADEEAGDLVGALDRIAQRSCGRHRSVIATASSRSNSPNVPRCCLSQPRREPSAGGRDCPASRRAGGVGRTPRGVPAPGNS